MAPTQTVFVPVDQALTLAIDAIQASGGAITDFTIGGVARSLLEAAAVVTSRVTQVADQLQNDSYLDTATGSALDALGANWQVPRNPAVQAAGQVTITRTSTTGALTIPAGFSQLAAPPLSPGQSGIAVLTTDPANFANGVATAVVGAQAVTGGIAGNLASGVYLSPLSPVATVNSTTGFQVTTPFTGGYDAETDDDYRARIPIVVQGRVLGRKLAFQAAALSVPGVQSASVLGPGDARGDATVLTAGQIEVYYQGSAGLLSQVTSAVNNAAMFAQAPDTFAAINLTAPRGKQRVVAAATVYCQPGVDPVALAAVTSTALQAFVNATGLGQACYLGGAIEALLAVPNVVSLGLPLTGFHLFGGSGAADLPVAADSYVNLAAADTTITVTTLP